MKAVNKDEVFKDETKVTSQMSFLLQLTQRIALPYFNGGNTYEVQLVYIS